jgi:hypothetical protein
MKVKKSDAVELMVAMGMAKAPTWDNAKLEENLTKLGTEKIPDQILKKVKGNKKLGELFKAIVTELGNKKKVTIAEVEKAAPAKAVAAPAGKKGKAAKVEEPEEEEEEETENEEEVVEQDDDSDGDDEEETEEEADEEADESDDEEESEEEDEEPAAKPTKKGAKAGKGKAEAKEPKAKKEPKAPVEIDKFGNRKGPGKGTRTHRINMAIIDKPRTATKIMEVAAARGIHSHLSKLVGLGYVKVVKMKNKDGESAGKGYVETGKKFKPAKK